MAAMLAGWGGTGVSGGTAPSGYSLELLSPNPGQGSFRLGCTIPEEGDVTLRLYSVTGRLAGSSAGGTYSAGTHVVTIEAPCEGVYFVRMTAGGFTGTEMLVALD
jgi:hypothetical protein